MIRIDYPQPTPEQVEALSQFAQAHGRKWKNVLTMTYWQNARVWRDGPGGDNTGAILQGIRNQFGGSWLYDRFQLPSGVKV
jgi:hypothetical protein